MPRDIAEGVLHARLAVTAASATQSQLELLAKNVTDGQHQRVRLKREQLTLLYPRGSSHRGLTPRTS
jgi:hypothetical protein